MHGQCMAKKLITTGAPIHTIFLALAAKDGGKGEDAGSARAGMTLNKGKVSQGLISGWWIILLYIIRIIVIYCNA